MAQIYIEIVTEYMGPKQEEYQPSAIFQQDDKSSHRGFEVQKFFNKDFRVSVGRDDLISWSPCSHSITPLDFLWGYVKNIIYRTNIRYMVDFQHRLTETASAVT